MALFYVVCCPVEVPASVSSLVQRSPTECGVSECDRESSIMRRLWPTRAYCAMGGIQSELSVLTVDIASATTVRESTCVPDNLAHKAICFRDRQQAYLE